MPAMELKIIVGIFQSAKAEFFLKNDAIRYYREDEEVNGVIPADQM